MRCAGEHLRISPPRWQNESPKFSTRFGLARLAPRGRTRASAPPHQLPRQNQLGHEALEGVPEPRNAVEDQAFHEERVHQNREWRDDAQLADAPGQIEVLAAANL